MEKIKKSLRSLGNRYIVALQTELKYQRHIATASLRDSFKSKITESFGNIYLQIVSSSSYMWIVNDGATMGVSVSPAQIESWAKQKGIDVGDANALKRFSMNVASELAGQYPTAGGLLIAPRRLKFIDFAFDSVNQSEVISNIENDLVKTIEADIASGLSNSAIEVKI
jgi:hypothetical protein|tara:strand:- start:810 stop:1313 length:504 start_codon:yes stop_codon:yes gene_type:complete